MVGLSSFLACQAPVYRESSAAVSWMYPHFWLARHPSDASKSMFFVGCTLIFGLPGTTGCAKHGRYRVGCTLIFGLSGTSRIECLSQRSVGCTLIFGLSGTVVPLYQINEVVGCTLIFGLSGTSCVITWCYTMRKVLPECMECLRLRATNCPIG